MQGEMRLQLQTITVMLDMPDSGPQTHCPCCSKNQRGALQAEEADCFTEGGRSRLVQRSAREAARQGTDL